MDKLYEISYIIVEETKNIDNIEIVAISIRLKKFITEIIADKESKVNIQIKQSFIQDLKSIQIYIKEELLDKHLEDNIDDILSTPKGKEVLLNIFKERKI